MNFNKKFWTMTLSAAMAASLLAGCGTSGSSADASASGSQGSNPGGGGRRVYHRLRPQ